VNKKVKFANAPHFLTLDTPMKLRLTGAVNHAKDVIQRQQNVEHPPAMHSALS
jgi:hypothetical protein